ncbi:MAG: DUF6754 domain-containing protein [Candidatus Bathyarchaeia archaeon]
MGVWIILDTKFVALLLLIAAFALFYGYMTLAKGGMKIKARAFPAVAAISEAIGRAAEMGKPVYYSTGMGQGTLNNQLNGPQTLAGISILGYTTRLCAKSGVKITYFTPIADSLPLVEETMRTSYMAEGKPEEFNPAVAINFQNEQSPFLTASLGWIQREKPAASILLGGFYYESVVLGEAGNTIGAMQIGGTANTHQLPFLVATCDYTLIMEELYAASAEISGNPDVLGSLRGEDILKFFVLILLGLGFILALVNNNSLISLLKV